MAQSYDNTQNYPPNFDPNQNPQNPADFNNNFNPDPNLGLNNGFAQPTPDPYTNQMGNQPIAQDYGYNNFDPNSQPPTPNGLDYNPADNFSFQPQQQPNIDPNYPADYTNNYSNPAYPDPNVNQNPQNYPNYDNQNIATDPYQGYDNNYQNYGNQPVDAVYPDQSQANYAGGYDNGYNAQPLGQTDQSGLPPNTFQEKKSGSQLFLIIGISVVVLLLGATIALYLYNQSRNSGTDTANDSSQSSVSSVVASSDVSSISSSQEVSSISSSTATTSQTGGPTSPASISRVFSVTTLPAEWITQKFTSDVRDATGKCTIPAKCGEQADPDLDGLTNIDEYNFQTDPINNDMDNDGISDGNEVYIYFTNPKAPDSDSDTYKDGSELTNCYDPILSAGAKMPSPRLEQIKNAASLRLITSPTTETLKKAAANSTDLINGYIATKCQVASSNSTASSSVATN